ncbi:MAG: hypothetical protein SOI13_05305 [Bifidobacterium mongoliense]|jgi:hypothetical protein|uniref:hypothetical protein n=1 Tax=Bifidobacterium mongoliense TaxID=518643 RepID=UPI002F3579B8
MFNLVIAADGEYKNIGTSRFFECTSDELKKKFHSSDGAIDYEKLAELPTLMVPEFSEESLEIARVGYVRADDLFALDESPFIPSFPAKLLMKSSALISLQGWENTRTHWAVKRGDLFRLLPRIIGKERVAVLAESMKDSSDPHRIAVMMPFDQSFNPVYDCIKTVTKNRGLRCTRVDDLYTPTHITEDISNIIQESGTVIVDITGRNPNVMYELGFSIALNKTTILISQDINGAGGLPFDIKDIRTFSYLNNKEGMQQLDSKLSKCFESILI